MAGMFTLPKPGEEEDDDDDTGSSFHDCTSMFAREAGSSLAKSKQARSNVWVTVRRGQSASWEFVMER